MRGGVTDKSHDALGGRRSQTRRAGRICANLGVSRLARSAATRCDGPLDLVTNPRRQNGPDLSPDALACRVTDYALSSTDFPPEAP